MNRNELIRKLVDYILLNAYSVNSTGLYNGKAGLSISLFCMGRQLNDEYIEDQAYELLQEALLSTNRDVSFEDGLAGIGYVLHYLITNGFIEADFRELFDEQANKIWKFLEEVRQKDSKDTIVHHISLVHFLDVVKKDYSEIEIDNWVNMFSIESAQLLEEGFDKTMTVRDLGNKTRVLRLLESYVKLSDYYDSFVPNWNLLERYGSMYQSDKFLSSFAIGYHLRNIAAKNQHSELEVVGIKNMERAVLNLYPDTMSLSQRIDFLNLLHESGTTFPKLMEIAEDKLLNITSQPADYERNILSGIHPTNFIAGYQYGIARLMLYWVYKKTPDAVRYLFL